MKPIRRKKNPSRSAAPFLGLALAALTLSALGLGCQKKIPTAPAPAPTATPTPTPDGCPIVATLHFAGNLNSAQRADQAGGFVDQSTLPTWISASGSALTNSAKLAMVAYNTTGYAYHQVADFTTPEDATNPIPHLTTPLLNGGMPVTSVFPLATFNWDQASPLPPAASCAKPVTDAEGHPREVTFQFYQVNDLGQAGVNPNPPHQAAWAWFAFETTGGVAPSTAHLLGGSALVEGYPGEPCSCDHGHAGWLYSGDLVFFNADGSLAGEGGLAGPVSPTSFQVRPSLYLPPLTGSNSSRITLGFGTAGLVGYGKRDGLTGDAAASSVH